MTEAECLLIEIRDLESKVADATSAKARSATDRGHFDLQRLEQELLALKQQLEHGSHRPESSPAGDSPTERLERKLDSALADSFPGSDAVSFLEPAPNKPPRSR
jgi:hypothetical protein